jgi:SAM-dependent methyltransferase
MNFLYAALESGLLQALKTGAKRETLIGELLIKRPELLDALLDMGLALKEISLSKGIFSLKGKRSKVLATQQGDALAALVQANVTYYNAAYRNLADRMRGTSLGDDLAVIGETVARFSKIMEPILNRFIKSLVPGSGPFRALDVGCGSGFVLKTIGKVNSKANGTGIDTDHKVAAQALVNLEQWGLKDRFSVLAGDIRTHTIALQGRFDLITAFNLLYYFPVEERIEFFNLLRSFLSPRGRVALVNTFQSKGRDVTAANLNIVNGSLNGLTTLPKLKETQSQLTGCGFNQIRVTRFMPRNEFYGLTAYA